MFNQVLGYNCSGEYSNNGQSIEFKSGMNFIQSDKPISEGIDTIVIANDDSQTKFYQKSIKDTDSNIWMKPDEKDVRLRIGTPWSQDHKINKVDVLSIWMDGEFKVTSEAGPYKVKEASCLKRRVSNMTPSALSQIVIERGPRLECKVYSMKPKSGSDELEYFGGSKIELNFNSDKTEDRVFSSMFENLDISFQKYIDKYFFDISNKTGILRAELIDLTNGNVLTTVQTVNSSKDIDLNYLNQGYGASIDCSPPASE